MRWQAFARALVAGVAGITVTAFAGGQISGASSSLENSVRSTSPGPVVVGVANEESQGLSAPEYRYGALAAINDINATGGIHGEKVKAVVCLTDGSPEASIACANKFVSAHAVVDFTGIDSGQVSALPILSGANTPLVTEITDQGEETSADAFAFGSGLTSFLVAPFAELKKVGGSSLGYVSYDIPQVRSALSLLSAFASKLGMKVTPILVSPQNPDWTSAVATVQADHLDSLLATLQEGDCTSLVRSARAAGFQGPIAVSQCSNYISALGNQAANTYGVWPYYFPAVASEAPASVQQQLKVFTKYMAASGRASYENSAGAAAAFGSIAELAEVMKGISGPVTGGSLLTALKTAHVPGYMGPDVTCGAHVLPTESAACSADVLFYKVIATSKGPKRRLLQSGYLDAGSLLP